MNFLFMTVVVAFRIMVQNRMRSLLTLLGIIIGVGSLIVMVSIGEGATAAVQAQIATFGTNVIAILPGAITPGGVWTGHGGAVTLTVKDMEEAGKVPYVRYASWVRRAGPPGVPRKKNRPTPPHRRAAAPFLPQASVVQQPGASHPHN